MKYKFFPLLVFLIALALALTACGGRDEPAGSSSDSGSVAKAQAVQANAAAPGGDATAGKDKFASTCSACHGPDGEGVTGLGKDMTSSEFIAGKTDVELIEFIKVGRDPSHPLNTTGVAMPPKGGNPTLNDQDLADIVAFIRSIHE